MTAEPISRTAGPREWEALERSGWTRIVRLPPVKDCRDVLVRGPAIVMLDDADINQPANHAACVKCGAYKARAKPCWNCK